MFRLLQIHMIEELPKPSTNGPRTMVLAVWAGLVTGFIFLVVMFACTKSMDGLVNTTYVIPIVQILYDSTGQGGAATLMILLELNTIVSALSISTAASRLTYGFARDHGLPWSNYFAHTSTYWKMPVRATIGQTFIVTIIGVFYFCSRWVSGFPTIFSLVLAPVPFSLVWDPFQAHKLSPIDI